MTNSLAYYSNVLITTVSRIHASDLPTNIRLGYTQNNDIQHNFKRRDSQHEDTRFRVWFCFVSIILCHVCFVVMLSVVEPVVRGQP
jgi:hypothetical protein